MHFLYVGLIAIIGKAEAIKFIQPVIRFYKQQEIRRFTIAMVEMAFKTKIQQKRR